MWHLLSVKILDTWPCLFDTGFHTRCNAYAFTHVIVTTVNGHFCSLCTLSSLNFSEVQTSFTYCVGCSCPLRHRMSNRAKGLTVEPISAVRSRSDSMVVLVLPDATINQQAGHGSPSPYPVLFATVLYLGSSKQDWIWRGGASLLVDGCIRQQ